MAVKMTELMEAEGRLAKSEIHQLVKALMLYMVSGSLIVALDLEILLGYLDKLLACPGSQTFPALRHTQTGFSSR